MINLRPYITRRTYREHILILKKTGAQSTKDPATSHEMILLMICISNWVKNTFNFKIWCYFSFVFWYSGYFLITSDSILKTGFIHWCKMVFWPPCYPFWHTVHDFLPFCTWLMFVIFLNQNKQHLPVIFIVFAATMIKSLKQQFNYLANFSWNTELF